MHLKQSITIAVDINFSFTFDTSIKSCFYIETDCRTEAIGKIIYEYINFNIEFIEYDKTYLSGWR